MRSRCRRLLGCGALSVVLLAALGGCPPEEAFELPNGNDNSSPNDITPEDTNPEEIIDELTPLDDVTLPCGGGRCVQPPDPGLEPNGDTHIPPTVPTVPTNPTNPVVPTVPVEPTVEQLAAERGAVLNMLSIGAKAGETVDAIMDDAVSAVFRATALDGDPAQRVASFGTVTELPNGSFGYQPQPTDRLRFEPRGRAVAELQIVEVIGLFDEFQPDMLLRVSRMRCVVLRGPFTNLTIDFTDDPAMTPWASEAHPLVVSGMIELDGAAARIEGAFALLNVFSEVDGGFAQTRSQVEFAGEISVAGLEYAISQKTESTLMVSSSVRLDYQYRRYDNQVSVGGATLRLADLFTRRTIRNGWMRNGSGDPAVAQGNLLRNGQVIGTATFPIPAVDGAIPVDSVLDMQIGEDIVLINH